MLQNRIADGAEGKEELQEGETSEEEVEGAGSRSEDEAEEGEWGRGKA